VVAEEVEEDLEEDHDPGDEDETARAVFRASPNQIVSNQPLGFLS
jgi:hypothetical protein